MDTDVNDVKNDYNHEAFPCPFERKLIAEIGDAFFMQLAYNEAIAAWLEGNIPVGALIERKGEVLSLTHNRTESDRNPTAHAEILAIQEACKKLQDWRLTNTTLYVTKEPCAMCAGAIMNARIKRVVFGFSDPKQGCLGGSYALHEQAGWNHRLSVTSGILEVDCRQLVQSFFQEKRKILKANAGRKKII
jgi:tRNA(adenine34) deaminase